MDQTRFVRDMRIKDSFKSPSWSFDLSSATDNYPVNIQSAILDSIFDNNNFGKFWKKIIISGPWQWNDIKNNRIINYNYTKGQPMGADSSWAVFAFSHHITVWKAAYNIGISIDDIIK